MASNQCWTKPWAPMVEGVTTRMSWSRTLELEELRVKDLYVKDPTNNYPISSSYILYADGESGTYWASDGVLSTLLQFGNNYLSSIPNPLNVTEIYSESADSTRTINANYLELLSTTGSGTTIFTDGTISANTVVVYGSNTLYNQGILSLRDVSQRSQQSISLSNQQLNAGGSTEAFYVTSNYLIQNVAELGQFYVSSPSVVSSISSILGGLDAGVLVSSIVGLGSGGYISSLSLVSTTAFLLDAGGALKREDINSTITGLATAKYVSSLSLQSTVGYLLANPPDVMMVNLVSTVNNLSPLYISSTQLASSINTFFDYAVLQNLTSTIAGLGSARYVSTNSLFSTSAGFNKEFFNIQDLLSTVEGVGSVSYISTPSLVSTVTNLFLGIVATSNVQSTVQNLGLVEYISTPNLASTFFSLSQSLTHKTSTMSTVIGLGSVFYISSSGLTSTVKGVYDFSNILFTSSVASTVTGLGRVSYLSTLSLQSTVSDLLSRELLSPFQYFSTLDGLGNIYPSTFLSTCDGFVKGLVSIPWTTSTVQGIGASLYVSSLSLQSTVVSLQRLYTKHDEIRSTVTGLGSAFYVSSPSLQSTVAGFSAKGALLRTDVTSTVIGIGSVTYISTSALQSTVSVLLRDLPINSGVTSSLQTLSAQGIISSSSLQSTFNFISSTYQTNRQVASTITGIGSINYMSSLSLTSTVTNLFDNFTTNQRLQSTTAGLSVLYTTLSNLQSTNTIILNGNVPTDIYSTVTGLGQAGYISTPALVSTFSNVFFNSGALFGVSLFSTLPGLGTAGYVSSLMLQSTTQGVLGIASAVNEITLNSTVIGLSNSYLFAIRDGMPSISSGLTNISTVGIATSWSNSRFALNINGTGQVITTTPLETTYGVTVAAGMRGTFPGEAGVRLQILYSTDGGINWTPARSIPIGKSNISSQAYAYPSAPNYNGNIFFLTIQNNIDTVEPPHERRTILWWSRDGSNWDRSYNIFNTDASSTGNSFFNGVSSRYTYLFQTVNNGEVRPPTGSQCNIGWYFENSSIPTHFNAGNILKPILDIVWTFCNFFNIPFLSNNFRMNAFAYNGVFSCIGGATNTADATSNINHTPFCVFRSYNGTTWEQLNVGFPVNDLNFANQVVTIGQYIYLIQTGCNICKRSVDGSNWETVALNGQYNTFVTNQLFLKPAIRSSPIPTGYLLHGVDGPDAFGISAFFNSSQIRSTIFQNIPYVSWSNTGSKTGVAGSDTFGGFVRSVGKDINRYLYHVMAEVTTTKFNTNYFCVSQDGMNTWTSIPANCNTIMTVTGIANSYDARRTSLNAGNTTFMSFDEFTNGIRDNQPNYIYSKVVNTVSTVMNINDGLFIKNSQQGVGIGAQYGLNSFFVSTTTSFNIIRQPNLLVNNFFSSPIATTSTITLDIDGSLRLLNDGAYLPSRTTWATYSDSRIKTNIEEANIDRCLEIVSSVQLFSYNYVSSFYEKYGCGNDTRLGFLANKVANIFPKSVEEYTYDEPTNFKLLALNTEQIQFASYGATRFLLSTINSRKEEISTQHNTIESLKSDISTLCGYFAL